MFNKQIFDAVKTADKNTLEDLLQQESSYLDLNYEHDYVNVIQFHEL